MKVVTFDRTSSSQRPGKLKFGHQSFADFDLKLGDSGNWQGRLSLKLWSTGAVTRLANFDRDGVVLATSILGIFGDCNVV